MRGTVTGVAHLAEDGYKIATDGQYREQVRNSALSDAKAAANFAATAVTGPGKAADEIGNTASHAWHALENAYNQAAAHSRILRTESQMSPDTVFLPLGHQVSFHFDRL